MSFAVLQHSVPIDERDIKGEHIVIARGRVVPVPKRALERKMQSIRRKGYRLQLVFTNRRYFSLVAWAITIVEDKNFEEKRKQNWEKLHVNDVITSTF